MYSHSAIRIAKEGGWLTPRFLGRYLFYKPPLLMWLAALSMRWFGLSALSIRLPVLLAGALTVVLVYSWAGRLGSSLSGAAAAGLLVSNSLWHTYSRLCQTDALLVAFIVAALYFLALDPALTRRGSLLGFAGFTAAAVMTKSIGGIIPLLILVVFCGLSPKKPSTTRVLAACALTAAFALPWHLYQLLVHRQGFWAEYVKLQIFGFGLHPPSQVSDEPQLWFYLKRLVLTDPILTLFAVLAVPSFAAAVREKNAPGPRLLLSWIVVAGATAILFRYRNLHYLLPLVPVLCLVAAGYSRQLTKTRPALLVGVLVMMFLVKSYWWAQPWGLPFVPGTPPASAIALRAYYEAGRTNELILVSPDDEFYSAVLPLSRIRYCFLDSLERFASRGPYFVYLGIAMSADQFVSLDRWREMYLQRLQAWGLDSAEPLATVIIAESWEEVVKVIQTHPESDFYLPAASCTAVAPVVASTHEIAPAAGDRCFLLARRGSAMARGERTPLPRYW